MCFRAVVHILRDEFKLKNFVFNDVNEQRFYTPQWRTRPFLYLVYRCIGAAYTMSSLLYVFATSETLKYEWGVYFPNWSYVLLSVYFLVHYIFTLLNYFHSVESIFIEVALENHIKYFKDPSTYLREQQCEDDASSDLAQDPSKVIQLPFFIKVLWMLYATVLPAALTVTIMFWWTFDYESPITFNIVAFHILNSVIILTEHAVTAVPFRLLHFIYPSIYGLIYFIFSAIFWSSDHTRVIYHILNWNNPGVTCVYILLIGLVGVVMLYFILFCIYRLKLFIFYKTMPINSETEFVPLVDTS
ncbi:protein rolling stone [Patella vulgata]|uniref:protein rolling stone n=1 Tax=Patella vulgata TaxID=6465 RepID=UPI00217FABCE|nr:protein rolling stone [Patella vulgata]